MDKKISKYEISNMLINAYWYYGTLLALLLFLIIISPENSQLEIKGLNFATMIFLALQPILRLKSDFYFSKINNVSRKNFIKGTIESGILIALTLSAIDIILIKIFSLSHTSLNMYEVFSGSLIEGTLINVIKNFTASWIYIFLVYFLTYNIFLLFSTVYFKLSKGIKIIWAVGGILFIAIIPKFLDVLVSLFRCDITSIGGILLLIVLCIVCIKIEFLVSKNLQESIYCSRKSKILIALSIILVILICLALFIGFFLYFIISIKMKVRKLFIIVFTERGEKNEF